MGPFPLSDSMVGDDFTEVIRLDLNEAFQEDIATEEKAPLWAMALVVIGGVLWLYAIISLGLLFVWGWST